ncbi:MAG: hypothetical protein V4599_05860 [Verrucomicrobiota bacterium]
MKPLRTLTACISILALVSCQSSVRMTALDRALVKKTVTPTSDGGVQIQMEGTFLVNPTAAVETFHTVAEQKMGGRPYRYQYALDKKQITRTKPVAGSGSTSSSIVPMFYGPVGSSGASFGEAALIIGSIALIVELVDLATQDDEPAPAPATASAPTAPQTETVQTRILQVSGTAVPIAPVALDRSRLVEVIVPDASPTIGRLKPQVAKSIANSVRSSFEKMGLQTLVSEGPKQQGYVVRCAVLRAQGTYVTYSNVTVELTVQDPRTGRELTRMVVQMAEKPLDIKAQTERQTTGVATTQLTKAVDAKLKAYVK